MAYATLEDLEARLGRELTESEETVCNALLDDAAVLIDAAAPKAAADAKKVVSCRLVLRSIGSGDTGAPLGATQGSMSALGYSQSWAVGSGGAAGELYLNRTDRRLLGLGDAIGAGNPLAALISQPESEGPV